MGLDVLRNTPPTPSQGSKKLDLVLEILRGEVAKISLDVSNCCNDKTGQRFCESYGCTTMKNQSEMLVQVLNTLVEVQDEIRG